MTVHSFKEMTGFYVLHNSEDWRVALHAYDESVNGICALKNWGIHMDSEEAFALLEGRAVLLTKDSETSPKCCIMEKGKLYVVNAGERHGIGLLPGSRVLIMENRDMSRFCQEPITESITEIITKNLDEFRNES